MGWDDTARNPQGNTRLPDDPEKEADRAVRGH